MLHDFSLNVMLTLSFQGTGGPFSPLHLVFGAKDPGRGLESQGRESHKRGSFQLLPTCLHPSHVLIHRCSAQWNFQLGQEKGMYIEAHNSLKNNPAWPLSQGQASPVSSRPLTYRPTQLLCCSPRATLSPGRVYISKTQRVGGERALSHPPSRLIPWDPSTSAKAI